MSGPSKAHRKIPRPKLDFSQESSKTRQLLRDAINRNLPIIEREIAEATSEYYGRRWTRLKRRYAELRSAIEEAAG